MTNIRNPFRRADRKAAFDLMVKCYRKQVFLFKDYDKRDDMPVGDCFWRGYCGRSLPWKIWAKRRDTLLYPIWRAGKACYKAEMEACEEKLRMMARGGY